MTQLSRDDVVHLAQLSKLQLTEGEIDDLRSDIGNILAYVDQLNELDTADVEPTYQVIEGQSFWREDVVSQDAVGREALLALAPDATENQVKVPKVL